MNVVIDAISLLVQANGHDTLEHVEAVLAREGLTLDVAAHVARDTTVDAWIAGGAEGAHSAWQDPVDHTVAGFEGEFANGTTVVLRPVPRRAAGPDILSLFLGTKGRFGRLRRVWLRVHPIGTPRPSMGTLPDPPSVTPEESAVWDRIAEQIRRPRA